MPWKIISPAILIRLKRLKAYWDCYSTTLSEKLLLWRAINKEKNRPARIMFCGQKTRHWFDFTLAKSSVNQTKCLENSYLREYLSVWTHWRLFTNLIRRRYYKNYCFTRNCTGKIRAARIMLIKFLCAAAYVDPVRTPDLLIWIIHFA